MVCHILAYAEMLFAWELPQKRSELLKSVEKEVHDSVPDSIMSSVFDASPLGESELEATCCSG